MFAFTSAQLAKQIILAYCIAAAKVNCHSSGRAGNNNFISMKLEKLIVRCASKPPPPRNNPIQSEQIINN